MSKEPGQIAFESVPRVRPWAQIPELLKGTWADAEAAVRADERERCAALCENIGSSTDSESKAYARWFAAAIRAEEPAT